MNLWRQLLRVILGRRPAVVSGTIRLEGPQQPIVVRRDRHGIPLIESSTETDAWFGLGFCHGQDRSFQLELYLRVVRGTLSALVGPEALPIDRLSRRIGFHRSALSQSAVLSSDGRETLEAYIAGINAGAKHGLRQRAHEFALLRSEPTAWAVADPLGFLKLQSFVMASNWDVELARLSILAQDGSAALQALDPTVVDRDVPAPPSVVALLDTLKDELSGLNEVMKFGGASNNWAIAGSRTRSGRPLVANDPHLPPQLPSQWYLASLRMPGWSLSGASFVGTPSIPVGYNGFAAWGVTAGLLDNTDLFLERLGPDRSSIMRGTGFQSCPIVSEVIEVRGNRPVIENVLMTPHGPLISTRSNESTFGIALQAVWLDTLPLSGWLTAQRARSFNEFRLAFAEWPSLPQHIVYADTSGRIGRQLVGQAPARQPAAGTVPAAGWDCANDWPGQLVPFDAMPITVDPPDGFVVSANNAPASPHPYLGNDWLENYRYEQIAAELGKQSQWTVEKCQQLQQNVESIPWKQIKTVILRLDPRRNREAALARQLLEPWDGRVSPDSVAASVYEFFVADLARQIARVIAPRSWRRALGQGFTTLYPVNFFCFRRMSHLTSLVTQQPAGWFSGGWDAVMIGCLSGAIAQLRRRHGRRPGAWAWGKVRPLYLRHPMFRNSKRLARAFDLGPFACQGDTTTVSQAAVLPLHPDGEAHNLPGLRAVIDVGAWSNSRFALAGGQSANPFSPHYQDLLPFWMDGSGVTIVDNVDDMDRTTSQVLTLVPGKGA